MTCLLRLLLILMLPLARPPGAVAAEGGGIAIVLSSNLKPYQEALTGIRDAVHQDISPQLMTDGEPVLSKDTRIVIAVGGKAALHSYPDDVVLIYCLAPGLNLAAKGKRRTIGVETSPPLQTMVSRLKQLQPAMKRLGVIWVSESVEKSLATKDQVKAAVGVEIVSTHLESADDLPKVLRKLKGSVDALWLPPDPQLISRANLATIQSFSWANKIPFYAPTAALAAQGAVAAISSTFEEMGKAAGKAARGVQQGTPVGGTVYPESVHTTVNAAAAKEVGLVIPEAIMIAADKVTQ